MKMIIAGLFLFMLIQAAGTYLQVKFYHSAVRRLHKKGNIGIGGKKSRFSGNIVIIVCNNSGEIIDGEILAGLTIFNRFKKIPEIIGKNIFAVKAGYAVLAKNQKNKMQGHIQAVDMLCERLVKENKAA
ncbi:transcriptional regulator GutM [Pectinatus frisingensis]|uniref:transcriptional regulator GutM n=1 Tax=Pectinatus frisingensis TaxID=865 RepID=UPI0015F53054|nr:transcriptional regulator GutM [Pectinatus frisingensis]